MSECSLWMHSGWVVACRHYHEIWSMRIFRIPCWSCPCRRNLSFANTFISTINALKHQRLMHDCKESVKVCSSHWNTRVWSCRVVMQQTSIVIVLATELHRSFCLTRFAFRTNKSSPSTITRQRRKPYPATPTIRNTNYSSWLREALKLTCQLLLCVICLHLLCPGRTYTASLLHKEYEFVTLSNVTRSSLTDCV